MSLRSQQATKPPASSFPPEQLAEVEHLVSVGLALLANAMKIAILNVDAHKAQLAGNDQHATDLMHAAQIVENVNRAHIANLVAIIAEQVR